MEALAPLFALIRAHPLTAGAVTAAALACYLLLTRKPRLQRDADARLSALRRDKADLYTKQRPMR